MDKRGDTSLDIDTKSVSEQIVSVDREDDESFADALTQRGRVIAYLAIQPCHPPLVLRQIKRRIETKASLELEIERQRKTVERLQQSTWGIRLQETPKGRFVVLPPGTLDRPPWRVGGRPAVRLSTK